MNDKDRIKELVAILNDASKAYYDEDREVMPNIEYDKLMDELSELEQNTGVILAGSPTQKVGYSVSSGLEKETHATPMLSLDKTKSVDDLVSWIGDKEGLLSWKLDGLTVALTYNGGKLVRAVTRGDGNVGEVVTANARTFDNLPVQIPFEGELSVRGEAIIRYSDFEKINEEIEDIDAKYKNPRNLASGSIRQLDSAVTAKRHVRFYAFELIEVEGRETVGRDSRLRGNDKVSVIPEQPVLHEQPVIPAEAGISKDAGFRFLQQLGFETVEYFKVDSANIETAVSEFAAKAGKTDLPSDGLVLTFDDIAYGESLGRTAKFPRSSIAFKWADELAETTLESIEWSASRTGLLNPIAVFTPVEIEGTTVSRASIHNVSIMKELALGLGDKIMVYKANMIIPQIAENLTRTATVAPPEFCPVCGTATVLDELGDVQTLHCPNADCPAKKIKAYTHFVSKHAINIEGLSEKALEKFISAGFIHEFADLFKLDRYKDEITTMEGFGEKSYENILAASAKASHTTTVRLLYSLGIAGVGVSNAKIICKTFDYDWDKIVAASVDEFGLIEGVGPIIAESLTAWFADESNQKILAGVLECISFDDSESGASSDKLDGLTFVITGSLVGYENRDTLVKVIEDNGGKTTSSVSEKTNYLINNDTTSNSSKNKKAKELGVPIINEDGFGELLDENR
jgi:DNA ligase (NAD+)